MKLPENHSSQTLTCLTRHSARKERQQIGKILVEFLDSFAVHRSDIGTDPEFKVKLIHNDDRPAYNQICQLQ